jgi:hypothetical protein
MSYINRSQSPKVEEIKTLTVALEENYEPAHPALAFKGPEKVSAADHLDNYVEIDPFANRFLAAEIKKKKATPLSAAEKAALEERKDKSEQKFEKILRNLKNHLVVTAVQIAKVLPNGKTPPWSKLVHQNWGKKIEKIKDEKNKQHNYFYPLQGEAPEYKVDWVNWYEFKNMANEKNKRLHATAPNMLKDEIAELLDIFDEEYTTKEGRALREALSKFISEQTEDHKLQTPVNEAFYYLLLARMESLAPYHEFYNFKIEGDKVPGTDFVFGKLQTTVGTHYLGKQMQKLIIPVNIKKITPQKVFQPKLSK